MSDTASPNPGFIPESWALYGVGMFLILLRLFARVRRLGIKNLQYDDYFVAFGGVWYTILCVAFNQMVTGDGSNLLTPEEIEALTPQSIASRIEGSKWVFVSEHAMLLTIWAMKAAMLALYARIISGTNLVQRRLLKATAIWVVCAFVGDELALFLICRPLSQYWAVPAEYAQCSTYEYYQIVNAVFNISTDIFILALGIMPIVKTRLSIQQKVVLIFLFSLGGFVIVAAICRAIYCLVPSLVSYVYMNWYFREASVAVYVTNLPPIWALLRELSPKIHVIGYSNRKTASRTTHQQSKTKWQTIGSGNREPSSKGFQFDLENAPISGKTLVSTTEYEMQDRSDSLPGDGSSTSSSKYINKNEIRRDVTFTVEHLPVDDHEPEDRLRHY